MKRHVIARWVVAASTIGTTIEWYDFFLYGTASALIFNKVFFPQLSPLVGTAAAFATYAVGYIVRPLGGIVCGHFGDRLGRRSMLILTIFIAGISTFLIGCLPTYQSAGEAAPLLLILLRLAQGFGIGGEWGGAVIMAMEYAPADKRALYSSWPQIGAPLGLVLATAAFGLFATLPADEFASWGWRVPFLLSALLVAVGIFVRLRLFETPAFEAVKETGTESRMPIAEVFKSYGRELFLLMGVRLQEGLTFNIFAFVALAYGATQLKLPRAILLDGVLIAAALECITVPLFAHVSDRIGRRPVFIFGALGSVVFAFPFFALYDTKNVALIWLASILAFAIFHAAMYGPEAAYFCEAFPTRVRYSGASTVYQLSAIVGSAPAALIATALLGWSHGSAWPIALYLVVVGCISALCAFMSRETYQAVLE